MFRSALRFTAGAALGIVLWIYLTPMYNTVIAAAAEPVLRIDRRLRNVEVLPTDRRIRARGNAARPDLPGVLIPADQLTYNIILLLGLFAGNRAPLADRGAARLALSVGILLATHVLATAVAIQATYATKTGPWGDGAYPAAEQDFWAALEYGYRLFGMFAIAFACWWITVRAAGVTPQTSGE